MPSTAHLFDDLNIFLDRYGRQCRIWKKERECGMEPSLSWWGFRPELDMYDNIDAMKAFFTWNDRKHRWEDEFYRMAIVNV